MGPLQAGTLTGTLAAYREFGPDLALVGPLARELGLAEPLTPWHGIRTPIADIASVLAFVSGTLGRIAVDVAVLTRTEVGEVGEVGEGAAPSRGGSSAMPQKRNPVRCTAIAAAARQVPAVVAVLYQAMTVEDERSAGGWHSEWQPLREALRLVGGAARNSAGLVDGLVLFPDRMPVERRSYRRRDRVRAPERGACPVVGKSRAKFLLTAATTATVDRPGELPDVLTELLRADGHPGDVDRWRRLCDPVDYTGAADELIDRVLRRHRERLGWSASALPTGSDGTGRLRTVQSGD